MRIKWVDIAKGIGILLVCVGHTRLGESGPIASWITSFHMPLFFVLAGLCFDENRYAKLGDYLRRKAAALLYPYFMLTLFIALAFSVFGFRSFGEVFKSMFVDVYPGQNVIGFWFLRVLIIVELAYAVLARFVREKWRLPLVSVGALIGFYVPCLYVHDALRLNVVLIALFHYEIGHRCRSIAEHKITLRALGIVSGLVVFHLLVLGAYRFPMTYTGGAVYKMFPGLAVVLSLIGVLGIVAVSRVMEPVRWIGTSLSWLGKYSILLLAVHPTCGQLRAEWVNHCSSLTQWASVALELLLIVALMWALSGPLNLFMKMPKLSLPQHHET